MKQKSKLATLQMLEKSGVPVSMQRAHSGTIMIENLTGNIVIEPREVLRIQVNKVFAENPLNEFAFGPQLLRKHRKILSPVKFIFDKEQKEIQLLGELPLDGEESLPVAYEILCQGIRATKRSPDAKHRRKSAPEKGKSKRHGLSVKEAKNQLEATCAQSGYELVEQADGWRVSFNTAEYLQRIDMVLNQRSGLLHGKTNLVNLADSEPFTEYAVSMLLLQTTSRLRFVRGVLFEDQSSKEVALEVKVPGEYSRVFSPEVVIASLKVGTRYTKLACEALLQPQIAKEYIVRSWHLDPDRLQEEIN